MVQQQQLMLMHDAKLQLITNDLEAIKQNLPSIEHNIPKNIKATVNKIECQGEGDAAGVSKKFTSDKNETNKNQTDNSAISNVNDPVFTNNKATLPSETNEPLPGHQNDSWVTVVRNKKTRTTEITSKHPPSSSNTNALIGTKRTFKKQAKFGSGSTSELLKPYIPRTFVHVSRLDLTCSPDVLLSYIKSKTDICIDECEELQVKSKSYKCFKIGVQADKASTLLDPEFWPPYVAVKRFFDRSSPKRKPNEQTSQ